MSIIYGFINLNNKPVERSILETMKHAMDFWGPDGEGLWFENTCGIGNLLYYNTPEAIFEKMPFTDASGNLVLSAGARIDNREELYTFFNVPLGQRLTMPDSALMLKAYEMWGEDCADHLVGDWAMAVWDKVKRKLFLARDHHGITALYYYKGEDFFVFSSSLKGILCLPQVPKKVNEYKIAQLLVNWNEGGPTTCYMDIMRLPPAHTLTLADGKLTTNRYWYLEHTPEVRLKNDQEYADMFLHLYTEAVRHRLRSHRPVGATLSSGLDSGSVCILAAKELAKEGKRLQAYTAVPLYDVPAPPGRIGNEGPFAQALAEKLGNVDVTFCNAENVGVLEGIEKKLKIHEQPGFVPSHAYWINHIMDTLHHDNIGTVLIGQGGNATVSWYPKKKINYLYSLFLRNYQLLRFLNYDLAKPFFLDKQYLRKYNVKREIRKASYAPYFSYNLSDIEKQMQILMPGKKSSGSLWAENGFYFKTEVRDPTIDYNLLKYLIGISKDLALIQNLFWTNFNSYFPSEIIDKKIRGYQSVDVEERLINSVPKLMDMIYEPILPQRVDVRNLSNTNVYRKSQLLMLYAVYLFLIKFN